MGIKAQVNDTAGGINGTDCIDELKKAKPTSFYGWGTGVIGLRLFPNPKFDAAARAKWNAELYYTDTKYYAD